MKKNGHYSYSEVHITKDSKIVLINPTKELVDIVENTVNRPQKLDDKKVCSKRKQNFFCG